MGAIRKRRSAAKPVLALIATMGLRPHKKKSRVRVPAELIVSENRFNGKGAQYLDAEDVAFGKAMQTFLAHHHRAELTCGEILDVAINLGYRNLELDFEICVHRFTTALFAFKRGGASKAAVPFPTWSEVRKILIGLGWYLGRKRQPQKMV